MAKKNQPTKEELEVIERHEHMKPYLERYINVLIEREKEVEKNLLDDGEKYRGILSMLESQVEKLEDGSYWLDEN